MCRHYFFIGIRYVMRISSLHTTGLLLRHDDSCFLAVKIGNANIKTSTFRVEVIFYSIRVCYLFPFAVPGESGACKAGLLSADGCHSLRSLHPPQAALPSLPMKIGNANTKTSTEMWRSFLCLKHVAGMFLNGCCIKSLQ